MYKKVSTNVTNILYDFINTICYSEDDNWTLEYPTIDEVLEKRRATISTIIDLESEWTEETVYIENTTSKIIQITTKQKIYPKSKVFLKIKEDNINLYMDEKATSDNLSLLSFMIDYENNNIIANLGKEVENIVLYIRYKTYSNKQKKYYVSMYYPEFKNKYYLANGVLKYNTVDFSIVINYNDNINFVLIDENYKVILSIINNTISQSSTTDLDILYEADNNYLRIKSKQNYQPNIYRLFYFTTSTESNFDIDINSNNKLYNEIFTNDNLPILTNFGNIEINQTIPLEIFNLKQGAFSFDDNGSRILPCLVINQKTNKEEETINLYKYIYRNSILSPILDSNYLVYTNTIMKLPVDLLKEQYNRSYLVWQFGDKIDNEYHIDKHKNTESPTFSAFFRRTDPTYVNTSFEEFLNINIYLSWNKKAAAFVFNENASNTTIPLRSFGYFGALISFTQAEKDDFIGNFISFGNDLQERTELYSIVPKEIGQSNKNKNISDTYIQDEQIKNLTGNKITVDAYGLESSSGAPYVEYTIGTYSEFEFVQKSEYNSGKSSFVGQSAVSKIILGHLYENERGYLDRVLATTKYGKVHEQHAFLNKECANEEEYIYIDLIGEARNIFSNSNKVIRGIYLQITDRGKV